MRNKKVRPCLFKIRQGLAEPFSGRVVIGYPPPCLPVLRARVLHKSLHRVVDFPEGVYRLPHKIAPNTLNPAHLARSAVRATAGSVLHAVLYDSENPNAMGTPFVTCDTGGVHFPTDNVVWQWSVVPLPVTLGNFYQVVSRHIMQKVIATDLELRIL